VSAPRALGGGHVHATHELLYVSGYRFFRPGKAAQLTNAMGLANSLCLADGRYFAFNHPTALPDRIIAAGAVQATPIRGPALHSRRYQL